MRIAFDYQIFAQQTYGGISRYFTRLAQGLLDFDQRVKIFAPIHVNAYLALMPSEIIQGQHIKRVHPRIVGTFSQFNRSLSRRKIEQWQPDIMHETYYAKQCTASKKLPTVITVYDMIHELYHEQFPPGDRTAEAKKIAIARADHIICISENTKKDLMCLEGIPENKISVVLLGFDQFATQQQTAGLTKKSDHPFLLYVGPRGGYKNFSGMLKAIAMSLSLKSDFEVIAFGGAKFNATEQELIANLGFRPNQVRQVSGDDTLLGQYYASARAFIYPSLYEGFGIPPLEAMAHCCPVISSNTSSMPEVIGKAAKFFNPLALEDMCHAIENVVYSESQIHELRKEGLVQLPYFSWKKCAEETLAVYQSLLGKINEA
jgi:glycosyltransferase involved in cell wall biosynthesis